MGHIETAGDVWAQAASLMHIRGATVDWFKFPEDYLEAIDEFQIHLAETVPNNLLGKLLAVKRFDVLLSNTSYADTKKFDLPDECADCLKIATIAVSYVGLFIPAVIKYQPDLKAVVAQNMYWKPPSVAEVSAENPPWVFLVGESVYIHPADSTVGTRSVEFAMVKKPDAMEDDDSVIEVSSGLRILLPYWVAAKLRGSVEDDAGMARYLKQLETLGQSIIGSDWTVPRENYKEKEEAEQ